MKILIPSMPPTVPRNSAFGAHPLLTIAVRLGEPSLYRNNKDILRRAKGRNKGRMIGRRTAMMLAQTLLLLIEILFSSVRSQPRARDHLCTKLRKRFHDRRHPSASADHQMLISVSLLSMTTWSQEVRREHSLNSHYHTMLVNTIPSTHNKPHR